MASLTVSAATRAAPGPLASVARRLLPSGAPLAEDALARRHRLLYRLLYAHLPVLIALGVLNGRLVQSVVLVLPLLLALVGAILTPDLSLRGRNEDAPTPYLRTGAVAVSAGLAWCSYSVIALTGGNLESHLHLLLMVSFVALYQDGTAFLTFLGVATASFELTAALEPSILFDPVGRAGRNPYLLSGLDVLAMVLIGVALVAFWRATEQQSRAALTLATQLERAELTAVQATAGRRQATSALLTHLARRNQSLLARQLTQLARLDSTTGTQRLEIEELQHLAARMRRNADSLLVLSGEEPRARFGRPEPVSALLRRVAATAREPRAVQLLLRVDAVVAGRAADDLGHVLEELLDNALTASPDSVTLEAGRAVDGRYLMVVIDHGPGMPAANMIALNARLAAPAELTEAGTSQLGVTVIARLAARHGLGVSLAPGQAGGAVALVVVPDELLTDPAPAAAAS